MSKIKDEQFRKEVDELKTLKDLKGFEGSYHDAIGYDELKAEAIKRIKFINEIFLNNADFDISPPKTQREAYFHQKGKVDELKYFLNLTEEELENEKS